MADPHSSLPEGSPGYETRDVNVPVLVGWAVAFIVILAVSFLFIRWLFVHDMASLADRDPAAPPLAQQDGLPTGPLLRANPPIELKQLHAYEQSVLTNLVWVDEAAGVARVPIASAITWIAEKGELPSWAPPPGTVVPGAAADTNAAPPAATNAPAAPSGGAA